MTTICDIVYRKYIITHNVKTEMLTPSYLKSPEYITLVLDEKQPSNLNRVLFSIFISMYTNSTPDRKTKYTFIKSILTNEYHTDSQKASFIDKFQLVQRIYWTLCKFAHRWKWNRAEYAIKHDLLLNPIEPDKYFVLTLLHASKKYLFTKSDLTNIIESALTHSPYIYAEPLPIKNPYNNMIFDKSHLYTIYFFMKHRMFVLPTIFHQYFLYNFHLKLFRDNNEALIRKMHISSMVQTNNQAKLLMDIKTMLRRYNEQCVSVETEIYIEPDFPVSVLISAMKPYLHIFYTSMYALDQVEKGTAITELKYYLNQFHCSSPTFGRKFMQTTCRDIVKNIHPIYIHDTRYTNLILKPFSRNYCTSHVEIIEDDITEEKEPDTPGYPLFQQSTIVRRPYVLAYTPYDNDYIMDEDTSISSENNNDDDNDSDDITVVINHVISDSDSDDEM